MFEAIFCDAPACWKIEKSIDSLTTQAGVYPYNNKTLIEFGQEYKQAIKQLDVFISWTKKEKWLYTDKLLSENIEKISFGCFELPFRFGHPWMKAFAGKKILVVSPFASLIEKQYQKRKDLFQNYEDILPQFTLKTFTAENTAGENWKYSRFSSWIESLNYMKEEIQKIDFDIAILGCGAYAFPLGAHCKKIGKKAITTCGATSLYFGIYGQRWLSLPEKNNAWIRPGNEYKPKGAEKIGNGAYW